MKRLADYSQYFLRSPALIKELVGHSPIKKTDTVYDIGAGSGAITSVLAANAGSVVAIEVEPRMAAKLRENMERFDNVTVLEKDFLTLPLPSKPYRVFANIPFHISSDIVRRLTMTDRPPQSASLIVQKQFAAKLLIGESRFTGLLGALIAPWFTVKIRRTLRRTDYFPHPNVDTVLVELTLRETPLLPRVKQAAYSAFVTRCFAEQKFFAKTPRQAVGIREDMRPSEMTAVLWVMLFEKAS